VWKGATWVIAVGTAVAIYKLYVPGGANYYVMPMDFFRAQGVDLIALIGRAPALYWLDVPWGIKNLEPLNFYTYGEAVRHSYLGLGLLIGIALALLALRRNRDVRISALALVAATAFLLALGPSLKINSQRHEVVDPQAGPSSYSMPANAAVMELPDAFLYSLPPLNNMREVSRWYLLFAFCAVSLTAVGLTWLSRLPGKRRVLVLALAVWIALEYAPNYSAKWTAAANASNNFSAFNTDAVSDLANLVAPGERVVFFGQGGPKNEYLSLYLCAMVQCSTYNAVGDKNLELARAQWPPTIRQMFDGRTSVPARSALFEDGLCSGLLDAVVLAGFDMRWDSYQWARSKPMNPKQIAEQLYVPISDLEVDEGRYFTVLRLGSAHGADTPVPDPAPPDACAK
jgi:uncharacterized membrane protein